MLIEDVLDADPIEAAPAVNPMTVTDTASPDGEAQPPVVCMPVLDRLRTSD